MKKTVKISLAAILAGLLTAGGFAFMNPMPASAEDTAHEHCVCGAAHADIAEHTAETVVTWTAISTEAELKQSRRRATTI